MKAPPIRYERAESRAHAIALLQAGQGNARVLAGGQSLVPMLNLRVAGAETIIDINGIADLVGIVDHGTTVRVGAMTRHRDVAEHPIVRARLPLLAEAYRHVAHIGVRNRGTLGGSLSLADPAAEMPACAVALQAVMHIEGPDGMRTTSAEAFFRGVYETEIGPEELLTAIDYPVPPIPPRWAFNEFSRRHGDFALVGVAVTAGDPREPPRDARFVFFGIADRPIRSPSLEALIEHETDLERATAEVVGAVTRDLSPEGDVHAGAAYRAHLASVLGRRAVAQLLTSAPIKA